MAIAGPHLEAYNANEWFRGGQSQPCKRGHWGIDVFAALQSLTVT